jgi:hypothetical protein
MCEAPRPAAMSVGQLVEALSMFSADLPVICLYDCQMAEGNVIRVEMGSPDPDDDREAAVLIVD